MTLDEFKKQLFPSIYKTRDGSIVEVTSFAFIGTIISDKEGSLPVQYCWDDKMNFFTPARRMQTNPRDLDLVERVKSPSDDPNYRKKVG